MRNDITYSVLADADAFEMALVRTATLFPGWINSWLVQSAIMAKAEMSSRVNEGVGANSGQGVKNNIGTTYDPVAMTAEIKPNRSVPYADALETGSRPHRPPMGPDSSLAQWCDLKGLNVWAVAKSIEIHGTKPHPFIEPTWEVVRGPIAALFTNGVGLYLDKMGALAL